MTGPKVTDAEGIIAYFDFLMDFLMRGHPAESQRYRFAFPKDAPKSVCEAVRAHYDRSGMSASLSTDLGNPCLDLRRKE